MLVRTQDSGLWIRSVSDPKVRKWLNPHCLRLICWSTLLSIGFLSPLTALSLDSLIGLHLLHPWVARQQGLRVFVCVCIHTLIWQCQAITCERGERDRKADEREGGGGVEQEWVRALKQWDWRRENQKALDCLWPFLQPSCIYTGLPLS